jgi:hypothetical protein
MTKNISYFFHFLKLSNFLINISNYIVYFFVKQRVIILKKIVLVFILLPFYLFSKTFSSGSYIIDMGVVPQTTANGLKPYGLIYDLTRNHKVPVSWIINTSKIKDASDFTYNGKDYKGGAFVISAEYASDVLSVINDWKGKGVIIDGPTDTTFDAPLYNEIKSFPNVILDEDNGKTFEAVSKSFSEEVLYLLSLCNPI